MLLTSTLERIFLFKDQGQEIRLTDLDPNWSVEAVMNHYASIYPVLTTAKISGPQIKNDRIEYRFESMMGTKG